MLKESFHRGKTICPIQVNVPFQTTENLFLMFSGGIERDYWLEMGKLME